MIGLLPLVLAGAAAAGSPAVESAAVMQDAAYGCITCHTDKRRSFTMGVHADRGIRCDDCHGGNPSSFEIQPAHVGRFLGDPTKRETVQLCSSCHADPNRMRPYGLPAGELAEFRTSRHGQLLLAGNDDAPTCTDCHDAHLILRPEDARSNVYPTNIAATCAACHDDPQLMGRYNLPTDQFHEYRDGAHGKALYEDQNFAAPTCVGCHGSHAALPPGVSEIDNVCGRCHELIRQAFEEGPHGAAVQRGALPGCLGCHSNHGTERVPAEEIAATCLGCHPGDDRTANIGETLQASLIDAEHELELAREAIDELRRMGRQTSEMQFRYRGALTEYGQMAQVQHSFDIERLEDLSLRVRSNTRLIEESAEVRAEQRWEHALLLVPIWFFGLAAIALAWLKWREAVREGKRA